MSYWSYGVGFVALLLVVAIIKSDVQTRIWLVAALIAGLIYFTSKKKR